jgi:class 3 adenylate cyclase/DNA-binding CsgD family transcriptional regulator
VTIGGYARRLWAPDYPWGDRPEEQRRFQERVDRAWPIDEALEERAPSRARDPRFREWWATYLRMSASPGAAVALSRMNSAVDTRRVLPSIRVPALILHRTGDRSLPVEGSRYLAEHIPGARYVELPGEDHLPFVGDQDALLDEVEQFLTGARPAPEPNRVLLTVAAVEAVETALAAARLGAAGWRAAVEAHGARVRQELARYRGQQIRTTGAGFLATFDGPARAVRCASAVVGAAAGLGLAVRAGVHTGECDVLGGDDGDIGGVAVQLACGVLAQARPGDVLVSSTVTDLVAGSGLAFEGQGTHRFEGVPGEWRLFRVQPGPRPDASGSPTGPGGAPPAAAAAAAATDGSRAGRGSARLTPREREVAALLAHGLSNRQIAADLVITVATAERHVTNVLNKLGFHSRSQIAAWAAEQGLHRARFG